jgi:hypothetical protein
MYRSYTSKNTVFWDQRQYRIVRVGGFAREIYACAQMLQQPARQHDHVDVRRLYSATAVGHGPGLHSLKNALPVGIRLEAAEAVEIWIVLAGQGIERVRITAPRVGLP